MRQKTRMRRSSRVHVALDCALPGAPKLSILSKQDVLDRTLLKQGELAAFVELHIEQVCHPMLPCKPRAICTAPSAA